MGLSGDSLKIEKRFDGLVRRIKEKDMPAVRLILEAWIKDRETGMPAPDEAQQTASLMSESIAGLNDIVYWVAQEYGQVVGVIGMKIPDKTIRASALTENPIELINAFVSKRQIGKGVGTALTYVLEQEAKLRGYTEVILSSGERYRETGWGFYDRLEFTRLPPIKDYYSKGFDAFIWSKIFV